MIHNSLKFSLTMLALAFCNPAFSQSSQDQQQMGVSEAPLAIQGESVLIQAEIDAAFSKIPAEHRLAFIRNGERVNQMIQGLLRNKVIADDARKAGYDQESLIQLRMSLAAEKELADAWSAKIADSAPEADYEALAYEAYLSNPEAWKTGGMVDVSHILISSETRSGLEAAATAKLVRAELEEDPSKFDEIVMRVSDDPSKLTNGGRFPQVKRGDMVESFENKAFAMQNPGDISQPVETHYGYHIIRLNQKYPESVAPFEEIKAQAMEQARERYLADYRSRKLKQLLADPIELPEGAVDEMVRRYFGENLELAPDFMQ
jgi:peptidyl-prolyl cis-trans isomerase C